MKKIRRTIRRRRLENKTDYKARMRLLKSDKPRVVFRKTNRYITAQIVVSHVAQDKIIVGVSSKDLLKNGWPKEFSGSLKNLQAAYLTGILLGRKSKEVKEGIFDIGLQRNVHKSKMYAFLKGLVETGFKIPHNLEALPEDSMLTKEKISKQMLEKIKGEIK